MAETERRYWFLVAGIVVAIITVAVVLTMRRKHATVSKEAALSVEARPSAQPAQAPASTSGPAAYCVDCEPSGMTTTGMAVSDGKGGVVEVPSDRQRDVSRQLLAARSASSLRREQDPPARSTRSLSAFGNVTTQAAAAPAELVPEPCVPGQVCVPPATYQNLKAPPPLNALVRYGGEVQMGGDKYWLWLKAGEPSRPCTAKEAANGPSYTRQCRAKIGEEFYITARFRMVRRR